jgi:serine/threonine protein kinase
MSLNPGSSVGPYEVVSLIGAGGMGEVYRARDTRLGRDVAIKVLAGELAADAERLRRFEQEARAVAALNHPNILAIHDVGTHNGAPYIVTELLEGETLRARLSGGPLAPRKALELAVQIASGLAAAHDKGIVHRDLKPGNVFITTDGHAKILDFGLAKGVPPKTREERAKVTTLQAMTDAGQVIGTVAYMSPEQVQAKGVDHRSDIFSFGVVLYEMVTGKQAFARETSTETMAAILRDEPPDPSSISRSVPAALSRAISHCLEKRPEERFHSAHDLAFELKAILADTTAARTAPAAATRRRVTAAAAVIAVAVLAAAAGIWLLQQRRSGPTATNMQLLSTFPGSHRSPTFSPDGSMIAFVSDADGTPQLWVKNLAGGEPIRITSGKLNPSHPSWSPRNDQIIFAGGETLESQSIWSVPPLGGTPHRIVEGVFAASFSRDGSRIALQRNIMGVYVCSADGSGAQKITGMPSDVVCAFDDGPAFSPDGEQVAVYPALPGVGDLWVVPVAGGKGRQLTFDECGGGHPVWTPDGQAIVFSSARGGGRNLWRIAATGGTPQPVTTGAGDDDEPAISRDGTKLLYTNVRNGYALMSLDVATGQSRQILEQRTPMNFPSFSPSGDMVAFGSGGLGGGHVFLVASDGTGMQQIAPGAGETELLPEWSADGESLYFFRDTPKPSFRKVARAGGASVEMAPAWQGQDNSISLFDVSPEGRRIAYTGSKNGGPVATVVSDFVTHARTKLAQVLQYPRWSHDGRSLVGTTAGEEENPIFICPPSREPCTKVGGAEGLLPFWSLDDSQVFFVVPGKSPTVWELRIVNRDGTGEKRIAEMPGLSFVTGFLPGMSRKGTVPWVQLRPGRHELWMAELKH